MAENEVSTAASRRNALLLREARNPTATYGARVQRRIRGRWFSLVPIRRRTLIGVAAGLWGLALLLSFGHYAAVTWPDLAGNWDVARPLRLDQPDSFGSWISTLLLAAAAGVSLLIYQLRRYRIDDFQGHYRIWRLVIILCGLASLDSLVSVIDWAGALLDFGMGKRVALSGNDWVRILVAIGGAVLAMRMVAEVRRSRWSLITMLVGWSLLAIPVAAKWNLFEVNSLARWTLVTTAPLLAITTLFLSIVGYLRLLYREVRRVEEADSLTLRFQNFRERVFSRDTEDEPDNESVESESAPPARRWWSRRENSASDAAPAKPSRAERRATEREKREAEKAELASQLAEKAATAAAAKAAQQAEKKHAAEEAAATSNEAPAKKGWFGKSKSADATSEIDAAAQPIALAASHQESSADENGTPEPAKRGGLSGFFGKKKASETGDSSSDGSGGDRVEVTEGTSQVADDESDVDDDNTDYSGMSKAERRRLRKLQRRGGNAA